MENDRILKMYLHMIAAELDIMTRLLGYQIVVMSPLSAEKVGKSLGEMKATAFANAMSLLGESPEEKELKENLEKRQKETEEELDRSSMFA